MVGIAVAVSAPALEIQFLHVDLGAELRRSVMERAKGEGTVNFPLDVGWVSVFFCTQGKAPFLAVMELLITSQANKDQKCLVTATGSWAFLVIPAHSCCWKIKQFLMNSGSNASFK